jgi:hypothetical protein
LLTQKWANFQPYQSYFDLLSNFQIANTVVKWSNMYTCGLLFQWDSTIKIQLSMLVYYKADTIIISWKNNLFFPWYIYSHEIAHSAIYNNHSLIPLTLSISLLNKANNLIYLNFHVKSTDTYCSCPCYWPLLLDILPFCSRVYIYCFSDKDTDSLAQSEYCGQVEQHVYLWTVVSVR